MTSLKVLLAASEWFDSRTVYPLAEALGFPNDQIRLFVVWFISFPIGWFLHFCVKGTVQRHLTNSCICAIGMFYFFGWEALYVVCMSAGTWLILAFGPRDKCHIAVTAWVFAFLSIQHINTVLFHFGRYDLEITTNTMLLCLRLQALGCSYNDGRKKPESLTSRQRQMMVEKLPSILELTSFTFYCQQCVLGVFVEYRDFIAWIECKDEYRQVPSPVLESLKYMLKGLLCLGFFAVASPHFPIANNWDERFIKEHTWGYKVLYSFISWHIQRYFFFTAFMFQTGTVVASGLGYNGRAKVADADGEAKADSDKKGAGGAHQWDKFISIYIWDVEKSTNLNDFARAWNHRVHIWLKYYVSERIVERGQRAKPWQYGVIFMTSAFWHGFYPFYYVAFSIATLASFAHKDVYKCWFLFRAIPRPIRLAVCTLVNMFTIDSCAVLHSALTFERGGRYLASTYCFTPISLVLILVFTQGFGLLRLARKLELKEQEKQSARSKKDIEFKTLATASSPTTSDAQRTSGDKKKSE